MGHNLRNVTNMLGLSGITDMAGLTHAPQGAAPGFGMSSLLGQPSGELPPTGQAPAAPVDQAPPANDDIKVTGQLPPRMSPDAMGMAAMPNMRAPDMASVQDMRQALKDKEELARQLYHPKSEFGTHGLLRDIVGNVSDFGRRLLGFQPRYNEEKWTEKAYGMTSDNPQVAAAAREQAMQYNPDRTAAYGKQLDAEAAQRTSSAATAAYKDSQVAANHANLLTGLGANLVSVANAPGVTPEMVRGQYDRVRPAIQASLDKVYGPGVMQAPEKFDPAFVAGLTRSGYGGNTYQRETANNYTNDIRKTIADGKNLTAIQVAQIGADARRYAADAVYRASVNRAIQQGQPIQTVTETTPTGSIVQPGKREVKTITRANGGGGASAPAPASPQRKFYNGRWWRRGPNGKAIPE